MKKLLITLTLAMALISIHAQQSQFSPSLTAIPDQGGNISYAPLAACDNEKGYFDFPFTQDGITVTGTGTGTYTYLTYPWSSCNIITPLNCIWIGYGGPATFTNTFSQPVNDMLYNIAAMDIGEIITVTTDAGTPTITITDGSCPTWFSIAGNVITCIDGAYPAAGARIQVHSTSDFTSITFAINGIASGSTMTMCFDQVFTPPTGVPVSNWALLVGAMLIVTFVFIRYRRMV